MTRDPAISRGAWRSRLLVGAAMCPAAASARAQGALTPPAGNALFLSTTGVGTQNYVCSPTATPGGTAFRFTGPQSALSAPPAGRLTIELADNILAVVPGQASTPSPGCLEAADGTQRPDPPNSGAVSCLLPKSLATMGGGGGGQVVA